jgi:DNA-binding NarL/FixJ family response regulator
MVGVLAIDDHPQFLAVIRAVVEATPGFEWTAGAGSGPEALELLGEHPADLALIDVNMPGMDGVEVAREVRRLSPGTVIALVSAHEPSQAIGEVSAAEFGAVTPKERLRGGWLDEIWSSRSPA